MRGWDLAVIVVAVAPAIAAAAGCNISMPLLLHQYGSRMRENEGAYVHTHPNSSWVLSHSLVPVPMLCPVPMPCFIWLCPPSFVCTHLICPCPLSLLCVCVVRLCVLLLSTCAHTHHRSFTPTLAMHLCSCSFVYAWIYAPASFVHACCCPHSYMPATIAHS
jgi:hypothetical protein